MSQPSPSSRPGSRGRPSARARRGFSVIEMLVVIGLIAFLTAAIVAVVPRVAYSAKVAATRATIKKVDELLNDRINGFRRWINKQNQLAGAGNPPSYVLSNPQYAQMWGSNPVAAKALAAKALFQTSFPQLFSEFGTPVQPGATHTQVTESSESLYLFLTSGALFDTEPPSAADLKSLETADTDNDGLLEIVDAWGHPLRFYRWPTRLVRPGPPGPAPTTPTTGTTGFEDQYAPSPATILMGGAAPRNQLPVWAATTYTLGATILPATPAQTTPFSLNYRCVALPSTGPSGPEPTWPIVVGATIADPTTGNPPNLIWQALIDPLSVDPDDPLGLITPGTFAEPYETPNTWNTPLIVSTATDSDNGDPKQTGFMFGLYEPYDTAHLGNLAWPESPQMGAQDQSGYWRDALYKLITNHQQ
jgi:prepilin-type N-terminal cleavage/methylation domain-containing protein